MDAARAAPPPPSPRTARWRAPTSSGGFGERRAHAHPRVERGERILEDHLHAAVRARDVSAAPAAQRDAVEQRPLRRRSIRARRSPGRGSTCPSRTRRRGRRSSAPAPSRPTPSTATSAEAPRPNRTVRSRVSSVVTRVRLPARIPRSDRSHLAESPRSDASRRRGGRSPAVSAPGARCGSVPTPAGQRGANGQPR